MIIQSLSKLQRIELKDLELAHLYVVYPGALRYPLDDGITALPLREMPGLGLKI